ncbi:SDR family NAD(P)-dependent oxidoreductase [Saccharothrix sp. 6-C]|uniref:type I polyketide synthase n=1 Tax=Saccharothrix sp. 6-C TaxID=2781735 RepID=UPI0019175286|nr:type I polyketide synthase [Saccharothrix sp. 6-C]QQQ79518.1 SDR family NAD(P)-dependent oxidoreductase [Saccharothrix sp. 6-C]
MSPNCPTDAVAIVGAACRLPGGIADLDQLWTALSEGRDLIGEVPEGRFDPDRFFDPDPLRPGKSYSFAGGFLSDVRGFDAEYFGISPREAAAMDPQQRMLLEMGTEALDDAGLDRRELAGSDTAVFLGVSGAGYGLLQLNDLRTADVHSMIGGTASIIPNRLSYALDLRGPSMVVDTACSSAMVALHQACEAVRSGRSALALAGGINLLLDPMTFVGFSKAMMLSPTFRCRSFSADADGYVRAEGGGLVVLKRLSDALADGDRVHAVLLATGTNTDGRTNGLAMPSAHAQADLLRGIYDGLGVDADDLVYLEAHGTGTPVGDPVECTALGEALGRRRQAGPLPIGSVKTNLGHLESASGMPGLFKAMLVLRHGVVPPSLHGEQPNPEIDFAGLGLHPVSQPLPVGPGVVGVNSFGFGGTNAHAVLAPAPVAGDPPRTPGGALPVMVSARSGEALVAAVGRVRDRFAAASAEEFYDLAYTTCLRRTPDAHRVVVVAADPAEAADRLDAALRGDHEVAAALDVATTRDGVAFAFSGNGSQWYGMGRDLLATEPAFRAAVTAVDAALAPHLGWSVVEELAAAEDRLHDTAVAQPLLFAVQWGLVALLRERGVVPSVVLGHSVGEVAAACVAGALDLDTAAKVVAERSLAQARTAGAGRMAAVGLSHERAEEVLAEFPGQLVPAAVNSAQDVTVAGDAGAVTRLVEKLIANDVFARELDLDYAFHSPAMDPVEDRVRTGLAGVRSAEPEIPMLSTVTGMPVRAGELDADYWWRNVRQPVLFHQAASALAEQGIGVVVEIGPHPVLTGYLRRTGGEPLKTVATLNRGGTGRALAERVVAGVSAAGGALRWSRYFPDRGRVCDLPTYPWQREEHWKGVPEAWVRTSGTGRLDHPLLGERMPALEPIWFAAVEPARTPWMADHRVGGSVVVPATGYVEMALAAGRRVLGDRVEVTGLDITRALALSWLPTMDVRTQVSLSDEDGLFRVASRQGDDGDWTLHARGRVRRLVADAPVAPREPAEPADHVPAAEHYTACDRAGISYGPAFRGLREIRVRPGEAWADYEFPLSCDDHEVHPALLDLALQAGIPLLRLDTPDSRAYLPSSVDRVRRWRQPTAHGRIRVQVRSHTAREACWDISVLDADGEVAVELTGCRLQSFGAVLRAGVQRLETVLRAAPRPGEQVGPWPVPALPPVTVTPAPCHAAVRGMATEAGARFAVAAVESLLPGRVAFTTDDLLAAGVLPEYRRLVDVLLRSASAHGRVRADGPVWHLIGSPDLEGFARRHAEFPEAAALLALHLGCGLNLVDVLCGRVDLEDLVLGDTEATAYFHDLNPVAASYNEAVRESVRAIVQRWPADRPLRVLEVGAGTGGTTGFVLPVLPADRTRYVFSDVSAGCLTGARTRFGSWDFVEYRTFDLDTDPDPREFPDGGFDLVIAANALHAATDLRAAVGRVARLLCPGGRLIAVESHDVAMLALTSGLSRGFWSYSDVSSRPDSPLVPVAEWPELLRTGGFDRVDVAEDGERTGFSVLTAAVGDTAATPTVPTTTARWVVVLDDPEDRERADAVVAALRGAGADTTAVTADVPDWEAVLVDADGVAVVLGGAAGDAADRAVRAAAVLRGIGAAATRRDDAEPLPLWVVARPSGALPAPESPDDPVDAATWGTARTLGNENRSVAVRRVSWDHGDDPAASAGRLVAELLDPSDEDEVVLTASGRFVPRTVPARTPTRADAASARLVVREPSLFYRLTWVEQEVPEPGAGQVVVRVAAAALNYRDIMVATGLLPPAAEAGAGIDSASTLGLEFAGVVTAVGPDVSAVRPGDRVFGMAPGAFASHVLTRVEQLAPVPDGMSCTEAATMPVAWITVHHGLRALARLRAGETVLVHGAAGGVGIAAVGLARRTGATVIATAGSELKRDYLRAIGVDHVVDSRSVKFADDVLRITGGRGVDIVLNSLSGEALVRGLEVLAPCGRFVEIGKRDIYQDSRLAMRPLADNISLFAVDIANLASHDRDWAVRCAEEVFAAVTAGEYTPLPHRVYPVTRIDEAFKLMQHSRHIGKVVVSFDEAVPVERTPGRLALDPGATYLVVGGLSGFGAATARRLVDRGARRLVLVGRRGPATEEARDLVEELTARGVRVDAHAADVTDRSAMAAVLGSIPPDHPLRGVVHAAMVLDDRPLEDLDDNAFHTALDPKLRGALVLDDLTDGLELDFFVLYSSGAALVGNFKQANYVAGNLFLEALTRARRRRGRPALAVQWGAIADTGYVAREAMGEQLAKLGLAPCHSDQALDVLEDLLCVPEADVVAVGDFRFEQAAAVLSASATPRLAGLLPEDGGESGQELRDLLRRIDDFPRAEALQLIEDVLVTELAAIMQTTPDRVDRTKTLSELGVDSLMGMELLVVLRHRFQYQVSPMELMQTGGRISAMAEPALDHLIRMAAAERAL